MRLHLSALTLINLFSHATSFGHIRLHTHKGTSHLHSTTANTGYSADQITVLDGLEPVRKRPGMYIGSTGPAGLHHLVWEVVDNSVDEALAGHASFITISINVDDSVTVSDNGRGIPVDKHPKTGVSALETVMTVLHAGGKFDNDTGSSGYKVSGGLHGVGISVVNALSENVDVTVLREGQLYDMGFSRGVRTRDLKMLEMSDEVVAKKWSLSDVEESTITSGTSVTFKPDIQMFKGSDGKPNISMSVKALERRLDEIAYLNAGLVLTLHDHRSNFKHKFYHSGGLEEYVQLLCKTKTPLFGTGDAGDKSKQKGKKSKTTINTGNSPLSSILSEDGSTILINGTVDGVAISIAMRWSSDKYDDEFLSFCNNIRTKDGGSHEEGLKAALTRTVNALAKKVNKLKDGNIPGEYIREGLTAIVSVNVGEPEFEGQTKGRLGNPEVRPAVDQLLSRELTTLFEWSPESLNAIVDKATAAQSAAAAARAARDMVRRKSLLTSTVLPGKLADCASKQPEESEIFIVEGDSAAGSAKQGRDRRTQAILPLRGKILNIERASAEKIYQNNELQSLISALGLGIKGTEFDLKSLRYHRIVIMTDADVDGAHIRVLLLTFFYRYQRELIENGFVYIACPPLYKISTSKSIDGSREEYVYTDAEKETYLQRIQEVAPESKITIQRFKGLGEMMPDQLWTTTMDPEKRQLLKVTVDDCSAADATLSILMGDAVVPRRDFISSRAETLKLDDLDV